MAEKVNIASLQINVDDVIKKSASLKKQIDSLKVSQSELSKEGKTSTAEFVKNEVQIKSLSKAYRDNQTFAVSLEEANKDLEKALSSQNKSTQELRDSRRNLNQISKNIKGDTEEEIALREKLNNAIDEQTEALREQSSEFNSSKDKIGEYEDAITGAFENLNIFNGGIGGFVKRSQEAGSAGKLVTSSVGVMAKGFIGLTKASLGFIATPIGALLAVLVGAFLLVRNAMNRSEEATNKIKVAFSAFSGILNKLLKILEPLGGFLIDGLVKGFELVEKGIFKAVDAIASGLDALGFDEKAESLRKFNKEIEEGAKQGRELALAEIALEKAQRLAQKTQLDFQKDAEKLRQVRDDETKTFAQRIKANEDLGVVLQNQLKVESEIAQKALEVANLRIQAEGQTKEALDAQAEALTAISDIEERITGQESEQLTNRVALLKEATQKRIEAQKAELDNLIANQGLKAKTLQQELKDEEAVAEKKKEILKAELRARLITQTEYNTELINLDNELGRKRAELAVDNAMRELSEYNRLNQSKIDSEKFLSEKIFEEEKTRLENLAQQRRNFELKRLEEGVISQTEFNDAINTANEENRIANEELEAERKEAEIEQKAIDLENQILIDEESNLNAYEVQLANLERGRLAEVENAEKTGANINLINEKYAQRQEIIEDEVQKSKIEGRRSNLSAFSELIGQESELGKALAIAEIGFNTIEDSTKAFNQAAVFASNPVTAPLAVNASIQGGLIVAKGALQAGKVAGIKFEDGGLLRGRSHAQGGIPFLLDGQAGFEAEGGEAIINKRSTSMFAPLLSAINVAGGGKKFMSGDILGSSGRISENLINYEKLGETISKANENLPAPVLDIQELNSVSSNIQAVEDIATF